MAVKILMSLEGVDQVTAGFADAQKAGEDMMKSITGLSDQDPLKGFSLSIGNVTQSIGGTTQALNEHSHAAAAVTEAYHILVPVLREFGVQMGDLRGLAALGRSSLVVLAGVVAGELTLAFNRMEEAARRTQGQLADLFQSPAAGGQALANLTNIAKEFGTTASAIAPGFEALTTAVQKFQAVSSVKFVSPIGPGGTLGLPEGIVGSVNSLTAAYDNFLKLLRAGRLDQTQAAAAATTFFTALENGGKLTADIASKLPAGTINLLAQALGRGGQSTQAFVNELKKAPIAITDLVNALQHFGPQSQEAFDTRAIVTFNESLGKTGDILKEAFVRLGQFVGINISPKGVDNFNLGLEALIETIVRGEHAFEDFEASAGRAMGSQAVRQFLLSQGIGFAEPAVPLPTPRPPEAGFGGFGTGAAFTGKGFISAPEAEDAFKPVIDASDKAKAVVEDMWKQVEIVPPEGFSVPESPLQGLIDKVKEQSEQVGADASAGVNKGVQNNPPDFSGILTSFQTTGQQLAAAAQSIWDNLKAILSQPINIPTGMAPQGAAGGGLIVGAGSGTSDSILARLSNREFVVNARSTEFYGPGFFAALNAMLVPRDLLPGFAMGGLVKAIASTPGQSARTPIVLNIDRHTFNMTATDDVAAALQTLSVSEQMSAAGRSPGWRRS